uniref:Uncharacterized protein n=1 Tax=Spumella elongata TaxID=89044 RepID=A0A7S3HIL6_9STRA
MWERPATSSMLQASKRNSNDLGSEEVVDEFDDFAPAAKRRRRSSTTLFQLLQCSHALQKSAILGIKERRAFVTENLAFDAICQSVRSRWPSTWRRLRPMQLSKTCDEDVFVAMEVLNIHMTAQPVMCC